MEKFSTTKPIHLSVENLDDRLEITVEAEGKKTRRCLYKDETSDARRKEVHALVADLIVLAEMMTDPWLDPEPDDEGFNRAHPGEEF